MTKHRDIRIGNDLVAFALPAISSRTALMVARRRALGWTEADDARLAQAPDGMRVEPTGKVSGPNHAAVGAAAVGLCHVTGLAALAELGKLRDFDHDIFEYGDRVATLLWDAGYRDASAVLEVGAELVQWIEASVVDEAKGVAREVAGFPTGTAQEPAAAPR